MLWLLLKQLPGTIYKVPSSHRQARKYASSVCPDSREPGLVGEQPRVLPQVVPLSGPGDGYCHLWPLCLFYILFHNCSETGSMDYGFSLLQGTLRDDASLSIAHEETPYNGICSWGLEPLSWKVSSGLWDQGLYGKGLVGGGTAWLPLSLGRHDRVGGGRVHLCP